MTWRPRRPAKLKLVTDRARDLGKRERTSFRGFDEQLRSEGRSKARGAVRGARAIMLCGSAALLGAAYGAGWLALPTSPAAANEVGGVRTQFSMCFIGGGYNCVVVDGDTIWLQGVRIRIADIDAPETHDPRCASEKERGDRATLRLQQLLNDGVVTLETVDRDHDRYGRKLRIVDVDGRSVGSTLVTEDWRASGMELVTRGVSS